MGAVSRLLIVQLLQKKETKGTKPVPEKRPHKDLETRVKYWHSVGHLTTLKWSARSAFCGVHRTKRTLCFNRKVVA